MPKTKFKVMKIKLLSVAFFTMLFFAGHLSNAQAKYGKDSVETVKQLSLFNVYYKQKSYEDALKPWRYCFKQAPEVHLAIYVNGSIMLKNIIEKYEKDPKLYNAYIDTLMLVYDNRIKYFGNQKTGKGYVLGRKGVDLLRYRKDNVEEAYGYLKEAVKTEGADIELAPAVTFMQAARQMLTLAKIDNTEMAENFLLINGNLEKALAKETKPEEKEKIKTSITNCETIFSESPAASCESLVQIFTPQSEKNKQNLDLLVKISRLLTKKDCTDSDLFAHVAESRYVLEPSAEAAAALAQVFAKREDLQKAEEYYKKAVELEQVPETKAEYLYKLALISRVDKKYSESRSNALEAIKLKPNWGDPYILIATLYAETASSCGTDSDPNIADFQRRAVYWVAVDKLNQAKNVDPSVTETVNSTIGRYAGMYPNVEKAFFVGHKAGERYTVGCWIQETTTIRF
jgi:tetratricopeptide (TPR) repeat protein